MRYWLLRGTLAATLLFGVPESTAEGNPDFAFIGNKGCRKCHLKQHRSWLETKMARSFELLRPGERAAEKEKAGLDPAADYTTDAECLPCHTTGYGQPGGFVSETETPELAGVGCEACHGAGGEYTTTQYMSLKNKEYKRSEVVGAGLTYPIDVETCAGCHNERSPFFKEFNFEERKAEGIHKVSPLKYNHQ